MQSALFLLSPLTPDLLATQTGMEAAQALKKMGASRADLTTYPRFSYASPPLVHKAYAVPDFTSSARSLSDVIFRPVVGKSDICDLSHAPRAAIMPELNTLATVGALFAHKSRMPGSQSMDTRDGYDLGLIFYLALHARPYGGTHYDLLVFPHMSSRARDSLKALGDIAGPDLGTYGTTISLAKLRKNMAALSMRPAPVAKNRLN